MLLKRFQFLWRFWQKIATLRSRTLTYQRNTCNQRSVLSTLELERNSSIKNVKLKSLKRVEKESLLSLPVL